MTKDSRLEWLCYWCPDKVHFSDDFGMPRFAQWIVTTSFEELQNVRTSTPPSSGIRNDAGDVCPVEQTSVPTDGPPEAAVSDSGPAEGYQTDVVGEHQVEQPTDLTVGGPEVAAASTFSAPSLVTSPSVQPCHGMMYYVPAWHSEEYYQDIRRGAVNGGVMCITRIPIKGQAVMEVSFLCFPKSYRVQKEPLPDSKPKWRITTRRRKPTCTKKLHGVPSDLTDGSLAAAASGPADDCQTDVVGEHQIEPPTDVTDGPPEAAVSVPGDDCKMDVVGEHKVEQLTDLTVGQPEVAAASTFSASSLFASQQEMKPKEKVQIWKRKATLTTKRNVEEITVELRVLKLA
ncbi:hypothetical protein UPYG_G00126700 [Umbra pygmaea]|uniref:Uncharacterized protein n=1 Tax=Umbra pygmaea TaxID=75934 RepID=A0ABD0XR99_UMBPY